MGQDSYKGYISSGKYDQKAYLYLIPYLFIVLPFLSYFYAHALWHLPYLILQPVFWGAYLYLTFNAFGILVIRPAKVRSDGWAMLVGLFVGCVALYLSWIMWVSAVQTDISGRKAIETYGYFGQETSVLYYLIHPHIAWRTVDMMSNLGFSSFLTWIMWIVEAIGIVLAGFFSGVAYAGDPFDEESDEWMDKVDLPKFTTPDNVKELTQYFNSDEEKLADMLKVHPQNGTEQENATYLELNLYTSDGELHFVSVNSNYAEDTGSIHADGAPRLSFGSDLITDLMQISSKAKDLLIKIAEEGKSTRSEPTQ